MAKKHQIRETLQPIFTLVLIFKKIANKTLRAELNTTISQFKILVAIKRSPNISQQAIAEFWGATEASTSRQIEILAKKGLISRARDPENRRKYVLKLTKRGQKEIKRASLLMNATFERIFEEISDKDREAFYNLVQSFISVIKEKDQVLEMAGVNKYLK